LYAYALNLPSLVRSMCMCARAVGMLPGSILEHADQDDGGHLVLRAEGGRVGLFTAGRSVRAGNGAGRAVRDRSGLCARIGERSGRSRHRASARRLGHRAGRDSNGPAPSRSMSSGTGTPRTAKRSVSCRIGNAEGAVGIAGTCRGRIGSASHSSRSSGELPIPSHVRDITRRRVVAMPVDRPVATVTVWV